MSRPLHPDVMLGIHLSVICSRNQYTRDPGPVIAELLEVAGDRGDVLAMEAGRWAGYYDRAHRSPGRRDHARRAGGVGVGVRRPRTPFRARARDDWLRSRVRPASRREVKCG